MTGVRLDKGSALIGLLRDETRLAVWDEDAVAMVAMPLSKDDSTGLWDDKHTDFLKKINLLTTVAEISLFGVSGKCILQYRVAQKECNDFDR